MTDGSDFEPKTAALRDSMKVVHYLRLVRSANVVQIVQEKVSIAGGKYRHLSEEVLIVEDVPMQIVRF